MLGRIMSIAIDNPGPNMWRMTWDDKTESEHSSSSLRRPSPAELEADVTGDDDLDEEDISSDEEDGSVGSDEDDADIQPEAVGTESGGSVPPVPENDSVQVGEQVNYISHKLSRKFD